MKQWTYTGRVFDIEQFAALEFPIGTNSGAGLLEGEKEKMIDIAFLPDGRIAEIELREWVQAGKEKP